MALLELRDAAFVHRGAALAGPLTIRLDEGERLAYDCVTDRCASVVALMAAGLVKATSGSIFIGAFDPRIQPVQVKRIVGFVPHEAVPHAFATFSRYIEYRAALWGLPQAQAIVRARALLARLDGVHEAFAYPLVGALLAQPRLLVLDRPQGAYAPQILAAAGNCAILSTHASAADAQRFGSAVPVSV
jgi:ABC-type taurine transport system ATPase subunit